MAGIASQRMVCDNGYGPVAVLQGGGGGRTPPKPPSGRHAVLSLHGTASKLYVDQEMDIRTFYVTQDREKPTDSA